MPKDSQNCAKYRSSLQLGMKTKLIQLFASFMLKWHQILFVQVASALFSCQTVMNFRNWLWHGVKKHNILPQICFFQLPVEFEDSSIGDLVTE